MTEYALSFMTELGFDSEAISSLCSDINKIYANTEARTLFESAISEYENNINTNYDALREKACRRTRIQRGALAFHLLFKAPERAL